MAKSRRKYLDLLDNIQDAICTDNRNGVITFANKKFLEYFSVSRSQIGKISVMDIVREDYRNYVKEIYSRCIEGVSIPEYIE
ncbi:PAS domain S-box protein, partial [Klebsiella quasipneumoniae]|uniref:PAS domain S-box protein n=1 Tax=Klebsiella quasipneumoniae TaxID=1463165 RepID=UPI0034E8C5BE